MRQAFSLITLGVTDLPRARRFYCDGLGFRASKDSNENVVFIQMGSVGLALFGRDALAADSHVPANGSGFAGFTIAQNLASKEAVDAVMADALNAGATVTKPAQDTFWGGYAGCFQDPDGFVWEIAWNPFWELREDGGVTLP